MSWAAKREGAEENSWLLLRAERRAASSREENLKSMDRGGEGREILTRESPSTPSGPKKSRLKRQTAAILFANAEHAPRPLSTVIL